MNLYAGVLNVSGWACIGIALALTHATIVAVTIYLHRHQTHRALELHPVASHFFRFWLWLTTGMVTREWVSVHRKHHARCETAQDPHSPQVLGIASVLFGGVICYVRESQDREVVERYGHGAPDDWIERRLYARSRFLGLAAMGVIDVVLFGVGWGLLVYAIQMVWIPFWAAGVINGAGHYWGYRNFPVEDASTNLVPIGILIGGEELHNNHHAHPTSAKLSSAWYEFDVGWMYIRLLEMLGLAKVNRVVPLPRFASGDGECGVRTLQSILTHRYFVLAEYTRTVRKTSLQELRRLQKPAAKSDGEAIDSHAAGELVRWLSLHTWNRRARRPLELDSSLSGAIVLQKIYSMRQELSALWNRSSSDASTEQLLEQLRDWRARAESSDIASIQEFARRLPQLV